jgi:hypothetical protein
MFFASDGQLNDRKNLCQSCFLRPAATEITMIDGPLRVCAECEAEWRSLEGH